MVIDYVIELPCEPKRRLRPPGILTLLRRVERAHSRHADDQTIAAAREASFRLRPLEFHCKRCPASHADAPFSCHGRVRAPLTPAVDDWLLAQLPPSLTAREDWSVEQRLQLKSFRLLLDYVERQPVTGNTADQERRPGGLFERRKPRRRAYGSVFRRRLLSTSQLLELLFLGDRVSPEVGELVCRSLGVWVDGGDGDDGLPEVIFNTEEDPNDDASVVDLKQYLYSLMIASSLDASVKLVVDDELGT